MTINLQPTTDSILLLRYQLNKIFMSPHLMRFLKVNAKIFTQVTRSIHVPGCLAWLYSLCMQDNGVSATPLPGVGNSSTEDRNCNIPCYLCHSIEFDVIGSKFPVFVDVHYSDIPDNLFDIHQAHFACLAKHLTEALKGGERTFKCGVCGKSCSVRCFNDVLIAQTNRYKKTPKYVELMLAWLPLFLENPVLLEAIKGLTVLPRLRLLEELDLAASNKKLRPYLKYFMDKYNHILLYHPMEIFVCKTRGGIPIYKCSKDLCKATPNEISEIFELDRTINNEEVNEILARFLFHALEISTLPEFPVGDVLSGVILDYIHLLTNKQFTEFITKGIISKELVFRRHAKEIKYLLESDLQVRKADSFVRRFSKLKGAAPTKTPVDKSKLSSMKYMIPATFCGIRAKKYNGDYYISQGRQLGVIKSVLAKLNEGFELIVENDLVRIIFSQYNYGLWFRMIYEASEEVSFSEMKARKELIEISNEFLSKLLTKVSREDVREMKKLADSVEGCSIPFLNACSGALFLDRN